MDISVVVAVLTALLAVTVGVGLFVRRQQRRPRRLDPSEVIDPRRLGADRLGETATLLQFSTDAGPRCSGVHRTLRDIADAKDGVVHLDIDLTHRPDIATHFHVMQTPTTLILDRHGRIRTRFSGTPGKVVVEMELARVVAADGR